MDKMTKREKIMLGVSIGVSAAAIGVAGYFGVKYYKSNVDMSKMKDLYSELNARYIEHDERISLLEFLVIESGSIPMARQNGNNKLARKENKIKGIIDAIEKYPNDLELPKILAKHEKEAAYIRYQLGNVDKLESLVSNDENIYTK